MNASGSRSPASRRRRRSTARSRRPPQTRRPRARRVGGRLDRSSARLDRVLASAASVRRRAAGIAKPPALAAARGDRRRRGKRCVSGTTGSRSGAPAARTSPPATSGRRRPRPAGRSRRGRRARSHRPRRGPQSRRPRHERGEQRVLGERGVDGTGSASRSSRCRQRAIAAGRSRRSSSEKVARTAPSSGRPPARPSPSRAGGAACGGRRAVVGLDARDRAVPEEVEQRRGRQRLPVGRAVHGSTARRRRAWPCAGSARPQLRRRAPEHRPHRVVELAHAREARAERDVDDRQVAARRAVPRGLRPLRPRQRERAGAGLARAARDGAGAPSSRAGGRARRRPRGRRRRRGSAAARGPRVGPAEPFRRAGAASGRQRRQARKPACCAAAAVAKKRTCSRFGVRAGQLGRQ